MPNQPKTPQRTFRIEPALWNAAKDRAHSEGRTLTGVLVALIHGYVADGMNGHVAPIQSRRQ